MKAKQGFVHIIYTWLIVGLAIWQLAMLFPALDLDKVKELLPFIVLGIMAEWLAVPFPYGRLSGGFALVLSAFLIYGPAAVAWVSGLAALFGQGIANRGEPVRTTLFNAAQYVLAVVAAAELFRLSGGLLVQSELSYILPLAIFIVTYIASNHLLVYLYLLPTRRISARRLLWADAMKWDGLTYLFTVPLGLVIAMIYSYTGLTGVLTLFSSVLALQFILRYYVRLQVANRELNAFYKVARFLEGVPGPKELMEMILKTSKGVFSYHTGVVYLYQEEREACLPVAVSGPFSKQLRTTRVYAGEGIIGCSLITREPAIIFDSRTDARVGDEEGLCRVLRSLLIVPLFSRGEALGVIVVGDKRPQVFDDKCLHIMAVLGGQAAVAVENMALNRRVEQALSRDTLTGLFNFTSIYEVAGEVCENAGADFAVGLILIDVDCFKEFNKRYGRLSGDRALAELAVLIEKDTRVDDLAARYGGDEFALLLPGAGGARLLDIAETLRSEIREHAFLREDGRTARLTVSIGLAEFPQDAGDVAGLFRAAERSLDKAKAGGGDRVNTAAVPIADKK